MWNDQRYRLYRNPARGIIAGVCAGIADYFGIEPVLVRLSFCLALFLDSCRRSSPMSCSPSR